MNPTSMTLRASSVPRILQCPASAYTTREEINIDASDQTATLGTAVHDALADLVTTGVVPDLSAIADKYNVNAEELTQLFNYGEKAWKLLGKQFPKPLAETRFAWHGTADLETVGHLDVHAFVAEAGVVRIADWKSGYKSDAGAYIGQMMAYAWLATRVYTDATRASVVLIWLRERAYDVKHWGREELNAWARDLADAVRRGRDNYRAGEHCRYCPRKVDCPALRLMIQGHVRTLAEVELNREITPGFVLGAYLRMQMVERQINDFRSALRHHIDAHGPIEHDGQRLELAETSRDDIDSRKAWPVLAARLNETELAGCVKVLKGKLLDAVAGHHERGGKAAAKMKLLDDLRTAGALTSTPGRQLQLKTVPKQVESTDESSNE